MIIIISLSSLTTYQKNEKLSLLSLVSGGSCNPMRPTLCGSIELRKGIIPVKYLAFNTTYVYVITKTVHERIPKNVLQETPKFSHCSKKIGIAVSLQFRSAVFSIFLPERDNILTVLIYHVIK